MITTATHPRRDTVIYDGHCRFCRSQIALLRRLDPIGSLEFVSQHEPSVARDFPELSADDLHAQMYVIDRAGHAHGGAEAVRYLSRRLPLLWPLAVPLHVPGSLPLWKAAYRFVARRRYHIAGSCDDGTCRLPR
jgi:predicted DCC family thiol-disulfide oxidoreductase YuxK